MSFEILRGDALALPLADESVDLIVTSPPYFALRSYQDDEGHYDGQIGSEATPQDFLDALWAVTAECQRVLKGSGSLWVNLGDKYANPAGSGSAGWSNPQWDCSKPAAPQNTLGMGVRAKSLMGLPWRYAIGCIDGQAGEPWILRAEVVWSKPNGLPESVTDRVRRSHEQWFHLVKEPRYYSAVDEIREEYAPASLASYERGGLAGSVGDATHPSKANGQRQRNDGAEDQWRGNPLGKLPGSVWSIPSEPLTIPDWARDRYDLPDHFAAFPTEWPRRIILGWSPPGICTVCGEGRRPNIDIADELTGTDRGGNRTGQQTDPGYKGNPGIPGMRYERTITGYVCDCATPDAPTRPAVVLDPFGGTGTTALVADALGRHGIHLDMSAAYNRLARYRLEHDDRASRVRERTNRDRQGSLL